MLMELEASTQVCANCGGDYKVELRTPDMDIEPVPLCMMCVGIHQRALA
jgi:hypothetical protein